MAIAVGGEHGVRIPVFNSSATLIPAGFIVSPDFSTQPRESTLGDAYIPAATVYDDTAAIGIAQEMIAPGEFGIIINRGIVMCRTSGIVAINATLGPSGSTAGIVIPNLDGTVIGRALQTDFTEKIIKDFGANTFQVALCYVNFPTNLLVGPNS